MSLRYLIEATIFFMLMAVFQYEISAFNKDLHISIDEYLRFKALEHEIVARGGLTYRELHGGTPSSSAAHHQDSLFEEASSDPSHSDENHHLLRRELGGGGSGQSHEDLKGMTLAEM